MKENNRTVKNDCKKELFDSFIKRLKNIPQLNLKAYKPASEGVLQERYSFACEYEHISVVYETNSKTLVITAEDTLSKLLGGELELAEWEISALSGKKEVINPQKETKPAILTDTKAAQKNNDAPPDKQQNRSKAASVQKTGAQSVQKTGAQSVQKTGAEKALAQNQKADGRHPIKNPISQAPENIAQSVQKAGAQSVQKAGAQSVQKNKTEDGGGKKTDKNPASKATDRNIADKNPASKATDRNITDKNPASKATDRNIADKNLSGKANRDKNNVLDKKTDKNAAKKPIEGLKTEQTPLDAAKTADELYKNGFSIKKLEAEKFDAALKKIKGLPSAACRQTAGAADGRTYIIEDGKNKVYMRYIPAKKTLQLQGRRSKLFGEVQVLVSQGSDYVTAVSSHIDLTGEEKRARDMEKRLKKLLPAAFEFLSEQSRIDLTIGMMDIGNEDVKLSDYSMLLVPPYRGLERLIFDLQRARGIEVKMIGQAFEKQDGAYVLKIGYRRKTGSIVFAEVMSALYGEYFAKRNFYAHSDITGDLLSRVITEKSAVKDIFANLVQIIEYNISKLKETGFKPA